MGCSEREVERPSSATSRIEPWLNWFAIAMGCGCFVVIGQVGWADELPLPPRTIRVGPPSQMVLGPQPMQVQGFSTTLSVDQIRMFYERELPKTGWKVSPVPQITYAESMRAEAVRQNPALQQQLPDNSASIEEAKRRMLYAMRGGEQLLLNVIPAQAGASSTYFMVNRWTKSSLQDPLGEALRGGAASGGGASSSIGETSPGELLANPCCSGSPVPASMRKLPSSIPRYPNGRMIVTGAAPSIEQRQGTMSEMYTTTDSVSKVVAYYRSQMVDQGWSEEQLNMPLPQFPKSTIPLDPSPQMERLSFRKDRARCLVAIAGGTFKVPLAATTGTAGSSLQQPSTSSLTASSVEVQQTVIVVNYLEMPQFENRLSHASPIQQSHAR